MLNWDEDLTATATSSTPTSPSNSLLDERSVVSFPIEFFFSALVQPTVKCTQLLNALLSHALGQFTWRQCLCPRVHDAGNCSNAMNRFVQTDLHQALLAN